MPILASQEFTVTCRMRVDVHAIDEALLAKVASWYRREAFGPDQPSTDDVERQRRVLAALVANPTLLHKQMIRRVLREFEEVKPIDAIEADLGYTHTDLDDAALVAGLQRTNDETQRLTEADVAYLQDLVEVGLFTDNMGLYDEAITATIGQFAITPLPDEEIRHGHEPAADAPR